MDVRFLLLLVCLCTLSSVLALQREASTLVTASVEFVRQRRSHDSHSQEESIQEGGLFTIHHSKRIHMQSSTNGMSMHARRLLSLGNRQILAMKAQGDKGEPKNKGHKHGATSANFTSVDAKLLDDTSHDNLTNNEVKSGPLPSPRVTPENEQPRAGKDTSDDQVTDKSSLPDTKANTPAIHCGESQCEVPNTLVSACLRTPGDGSYKLSLLIMNVGDSEVLVNVSAPEYLEADRPNVLVPKDKSETIQFKLNSKYELSISKTVNKNITVATDNGHCEIAAPLEYPHNSVPERLVTPRVVAYLGVFVLVLALVGAWLCYKCCGKKRAGDVKYQQLEMIVPGQSTPKERDELRTEGWDEVWDDDWEDAEAAKSSSRLSQNLSSRGLGARRGNKDGWDSSWED